MKSVDLTKQVLDEVRRDLSWKPPLLLLFEVGDQLRTIPMSHPLRAWWGAHRFETLCGVDDSEKTKLINSRLLWAVGETAVDDIDLDF